MTNGELISLLRDLSTEEKVAQLCQVDMKEFADEAASATGPITGRGERFTRAVGSVICGANADPEVFARVQERIRAQSPHGIPALFMSDVIHGWRTIFPIPLALGCTFDPELVRRTARVSALECAASGIHCTFAPMADVARDPRWGRCMESAGESLRLCAEMAAATVRGFQDTSLKKESAVACCVKHFAGYALVEAGREYAATDVSRIELFNTYFPPFQAALDAGCRLVMPAFTPVDRVPAVMNEWLLKTVLRTRWSFDGVVISDWGAVGELVTHGVARDGREAAYLSLMAGNDVDMMSGLYADELVALLEDGVVPMARLDEAVLRVLRLKNDLGLFERPCRNDSRNVQAQVIGNPSHRTLALEAALESCVLLQNKGVLPVAPGARIALVGDHADTGCLLGSWAADGKSEETPTLRQCFAAHTELTKPNQADVIVYAVGEQQEDTGEAASKASPVLTSEQMDQLHCLHELGKPVVLVIFAGRPLVLTETLPLCDAALLAWFPGSEGAEAVRRLVMGEEAPSGHLCMTLQRSIGQIPIHHDALTTGRPDLGDPHNTYVSRYLDEASQPLFPFGFGLSYTRFSIHGIELKGNVMRADQPLNLTCLATNEGMRAGATVVQVYIECAHAPRLHAVRQLAAFRRVRLSPGETVRIDFTLTKSLLTAWDSEGRATVYESDYRVYVGQDSTAPLAGSFTWQRDENGSF